MLRSVLAVLSGFAIMAFIVMAGTLLAMRLFIGDIPRGKPLALGAPVSARYLIANLIVSGFAALLGGVTTALVAVSHVPAHAGALAAMMVAMSLVSMKQAGHSQPRWYQLLLLVGMPALALLGAMLEVSLAL